MPPYVVWALIGMTGYSFTSLFVKLAVRAGLGGYVVLAVASVVVLVATAAIVLVRGDLAAASFNRAALGWSLAAGIALAVAVSSFFRALASGPASLVVPIYGLFIAGGAVLGMMVLHEPLTARKAAGLGAALIAIWLLAA
jgi:bacterial/archaeal transporter family protein